MSENFIKMILYITVTVAIVIGIALTVIGGLLEGWAGVSTILGGQAVFVILLYLYNRKYK